MKEQRIIVKFLVKEGKNSAKVFGLLQNRYSDTTMLKSIVYKEVIISKPAAKM